MMYKYLSGVTHIPSALSQVYYIDALFSGNIVTPYEHNIVIGKPFGSIAYYYIWYKLGYIPHLNYSPVVKDYEIDFVDFSDEVIGNSLGVASGIEIANKKLTWVNLPDSALQSGSIYEAIWFIGKHKQNIKVTIDYNRMQLVGGLQTNVDSDISMFSKNGWKVFILDDKKRYFRYLDLGFKENGPVVFFIMTTKGDGVRQMEENPIGWHYRPIEDGDEITISEPLKRLGLFDTL